MISRDPYDVTRVTVAIAIDGQQDLPRLPDGDYDLDPTKKPVQIFLTPEELKKAENIVKKAINFDDARGDQVAVENIMFDRTAYWNSIREEYRKKEQVNTGNDTFGEFLQAQESLCRDTMPQDYFFEQ